MHDREMVLKHIENHLTDLQRKIDEKHRTKVERSIHKSTHHIKTHTHTKDVNHNDE